MAYKGFRAFGLYVSLLIVSGCGLLADKDQIVVARVDGAPITRGDVRQALRVMPDDERPIIGNRGDLERFLREMIDRRLRDSLRLELEQEGNISVPMEAAQQRYFAEHPDQAMIPTLTDPTPLGISEAQLESLKRQVDDEIGEVHEAMMREAAAQYFTKQAVDEGLITISQEELEREYAIQKENLRSFEYIEFIGLRFPAAMPNAVTLASDVRRRVDAGENFDDIVGQFVQQNPDLVLGSRFENNPNSQAFRTFWLTATGAEAGDIIGPVFIPAYSLMNDKGESIQMPDAYLVLRVEEHKPTEPLPFEQATPYLAQFIAARKAVELMRQQHNVEFYDEDLWDPGMATDEDLSI